VESAKALLTERTTEHDSLDTLARLLHTSVFHLGRVFRERTGFSLHAYRTQLRLRLALDRLRDPGVELSALALELGFNSHSHFTGAFRSVFGVPPSEIRAAMAGRLLRELRKTVEAPLPSPS
jgi:AraC-like DNA-binding protein